MRVPSRPDSSGSPLESQQDTLEERLQGKSILSTVPLLGVLVLVAACGRSPPDAPPPDADDGPGTPGSLTLVTPAAAFVARQLLVQISGAGTRFGDATTVDFGDPEVRVLSTTAGSPGNLRVQLDIGARARFGPHDITVVTPAAAGKPEERLVLRGGLTLHASLSTAGSAPGQPVPQGGLLDLRLTNLDFQAHPFAPGSLLRSLGGCLLLGVDEASPSLLVGPALVDATAPPGGLGVMIEAGAALSRSLVYVSDPNEPQGVQVARRQAVLLVPGERRSGLALSAPRQVDLYRLVSPRPDQVVQLTLSSVGEGLAHSGLLAVLSDAAGRFSAGHFVVATRSHASLQAVGLLRQPGEHHIALLTPDLSGGSQGYGYELTAHLATARRMGSLREPPGGDLPGQPLVDLVLDGPLFADDGAVDAAADEDFIRFRAASAGWVHIMATHPGSPAQPLVSVASGDCIDELLPYTATQQSLEVVAGRTYCARIAGQVVPYQLVLTPALP
ncbi:MAG: hypothetical protein RMK29_18450 [Myxococcales bacterium]|nr:hypothetical protein [Myxococcota bacterium]MDW8283690.1 hypothetical protein [Myxococcales bacterium]